MKRSLVVLTFAAFGTVLFLCGAVASGVEAMSFAPHADFGVGGPPRSVAIGDFNGDGKQDLVTANYYTNSVSVLLGDGDGGFAANIDYATGESPCSVAIGDFNGDGRRDLVTANSGSTGYGSEVSVLLGLGDGSFAAKSDFATGVGIRSVAIGDFNGDARQDLVTANVVAQTVSVLLGDGDGGFAAGVDYAADEWPCSVAIGDFNRDGRQDLVTANITTTTYDNNTVSVLLGLGDGTFAAHVDYRIGFGRLEYGTPTSIAVGRLANSDAIPDLAVACGDDGKVCFMAGVGNGTFVFGNNQVAGESPAGGTPYSIAVGNDFNGCRLQYAVVANFHQDTAGVLGRRGTGTQSFRTGGGPASVAIGDFNGDGKEDLVTANVIGNTVSLLLNTTKPRIASLKPARGRAGSTVTVTGSPDGWSFGATRGTSKVYFGTKAVTRYVSWSKYQIKVRVPALAKGKKAVTVRTSAGKSNVKYFTVL